MFKRKGGGVKGLLNNVKKTALFLKDCFPKPINESGSKTIPGYNCDNSCAKPDTPLRYKQSRLNMGEKVFSQCQSQKIHCSYKFSFCLFVPTTMILKGMFVPGLPISWNRPSSLSLIYLYSLSLGES